MRKLILAVMLAGMAAMPALAQDEGRHGRARDGAGPRNDGGAEARAARRAERIERSSTERPATIERPDETERAPWTARREDRRPPTPQPDVSAQVVEPQPAQSLWRHNGERRRWGQPGEQPRGSGGDRRDPARIDPPRTGDGQPATRPFDQGPGQWRRSERSDGRIRDDRRDRNPDWRQDRGTVVQRDDHRRGAWSNQWRNDRQYDWRNYRDRNRSLFQLGRYHDRFGSGYRRFSIGFSLFPGYYQSNYWLDDPSMYRLPQVYGPYRWVRYYDDALLVNVYTGQVVDVVYSFFW